MFEQALQKVQELSKLIVANDSKVYSVAQLASKFFEIGEDPSFRHDLVVREMGRVTEKMAKDNPHRLITAAELQGIYNQIISIYPQSKFKSLFGSLFCSTQESKPDTRPQLMGAEYNDIVERSINQPKEKVVQADNKALQFDKVEVPEELRPFSEVLEENLNLADSKFSKESAELGKTLVRNELANLGYNCNNVKIVKSNDRAIMYEVAIDTEKGNLKIGVPVEVKNGSVLFPIVFAFGDDAYDLNKEGMQRFIQKHGNEYQVVRYDGRMLDMTYNQLKKAAIEAIAKRDFPVVEEVLNAVEDKFGMEKHRTLFAECSDAMQKMSKTASYKCMGCPYFQGKGCSVGRCAKLAMSVDKIEKVGEHCYVTRPKFDTEDEMSSVCISNSKVLLT